MKRICVRVLLGIVILAFVSGFMGEVVYADSHQDCSCCAANKCHSNTKCHNTAKVCTCNYQTTQVFLPKSDTLPGLSFNGYLVYNPNFAYLYLSAEDIFHPPKAY